MSLRKELKLEKEEFSKFKQRFEDKRIIVYPEDKFFFDIFMNWKQTETCGLDGWAFINLGSNTLLVSKDMVPEDEQKNYPIKDEELRLIKEIAKESKRRMYELANIMAKGIVNSDTTPEETKLGMKEWLAVRKA